MRNGWMVVAALVVGAVSPGRSDAQPEKKPGDGSIAAINAVIPAIDRMLSIPVGRACARLVYGVVADGRSSTSRPSTRTSSKSGGHAPAVRIASMTKSFTALSILKLRDEAASLDDLAETHVPECALALSDQRLAAHPRRDLLITRRLRHRRPVGRSTAAHARGGVHRAAAQRRAVRPGAWHRHGIFQPRLCAAWPDRRQCVGGALSHVCRTEPAHPAGHDIERL